MTNAIPDRITFRIKPEEYRKIEADAKLAGMVIGTYVRSRLLDAPVTAPMYRRSQLKRLIMRFIGHIGKVGNNMNQIAWKLNTDQVLTPLDREQHEEGVKALKEMRALLIDHLLRRGPGC